jgi:flagellar protein FliO/FliZ
MFESLFGAEMPLPVRFFIAFLIVLGLIGVTAWIVRRFGGERLGAATARGRQPRLAVIDAAAVDGRRRLILIRRDNVEHLLMIGGPTDVVIEPNIVRAVAATREPPAPSRAPAAADTLPRAVPLGDAGMWPLQPEPAPLPRPQRSPVPEEPVQWSDEPELPPQPAPPRRQSRPVDPLAGLAAEVARLPDLPRAPMPTDLGGPGSFVPREPARQRDTQIEREPVREREPAREPMREREPTREREPARMREPQPPPSLSDPEFNANADQNLADMAQRLEAALRRPTKTNEARPAEPAPRAMGADMDAAPPPHPRAAPPPADTSAARAEPKPAKSVYDSLEKEMANLLGRPSGKS